MVKIKGVNEIRHFLPQEQVAVSSHHGSGKQTAEVDLRVH